MVGAELIPLIRVALASLDDTTNPYEFLARQFQALLPVLSSPAFDKVIYVCLAAHLISLANKAVYFFLAWKKSQIWFFKKRPMQGGVYTAHNTSLFIQLTSLAYVITALAGLVLLLKYNLPSLTKHVYLPSFLGLYFITLSGCAETYGCLFLFVSNRQSNEQTNFAPSLRIRPAYLNAYWIITLVLTTAIHIPLLAKFDMAHTTVINDATGFLGYLNENSANWQGGALDSAGIDQIVNMLASFFNAMESSYFWARVMSLAGLSLFLVNLILVWLPANLVHQRLLLRHIRTLRQAIETGNISSHEQTSSRSEADANQHLRRLVAMCRRRFAIAFILLAAGITISSFVLVLASSPSKTLLQPTRFFIFIGGLYLTYAAIGLPIGIALTLNLVSGNKTIAMDQTSKFTNSGLLSTHKVSPSFASSQQFGSAPKNLAIFVTTEKHREEDSISLHSRTHSLEDVEEKSVV